jgi:hypothetical protein
VTLTVFLNNAGPRFLAIPGSSSHELRFLCRVSGRLKPAHWPQPLGAFHGVPLLLRDENAPSPLAGRSPIPTYVPPSTFLTLSTVCSSLHLVGLFHPTATSEIHPPRAFPAAQPYWLIASSCSLDLSLRSPLQPSCLTYTRQHSLAFRAFLQAPIR